MVSVTDLSPVDSHVSDDSTPTSTSCSGATTGISSPAISAIPLSSSSLYSTISSTSTFSGDHIRAATAPSLTGDLLHAAISLLQSLLAPPYTFSPKEITHIVTSSHLPDVAPFPPPTVAASQFPFSTHPPLTYGAPISSLQPPAAATLNPTLQNSAAATQIPNPHIPATHFPSLIHYATVTPLNPSPHSITALLRRIALLQISDNAGKSTAACSSSLNLLISFPDLFNIISLPNAINRIFRISLTSLLRDTAVLFFLLLVFLVSNPRCCLRFLLYED